MRKCSRGPPPMEKKQPGENGATQAKGAGASPADGVVAIEVAPPTGGSLLVLEPPAEVTVTFKNIACHVPRLGGGSSSPWASAKGLVLGKQDALQSKNEMRQVGGQMAGFVSGRWTACLDHSGCLKLQCDGSAAAQGRCRLSLPACLQVLFSVSGTCEPGEMLALMGPSGGGKVRRHACMRGWTAVCAAAAAAVLNTRSVPVYVFDFACWPLISCRRCCCRSWAATRPPLTVVPACPLCVPWPLSLQTTLLSILGGRTPKQTRPEGRVMFNGARITKRVKRQIGFVLQVGRMDGWWVGGLGCVIASPRE